MVDECRRLDDAQPYGLVPTGFQLDPAKVGQVGEFSRQGAATVFRVDHIQFGTPDDFGLNDAGLTWSQLQGLKYDKAITQRVPEMQANRFKLLVPAVLIVLATAGTAQPETDRYMIHVDGLACPFCAYGIEKRLRKVEGVTEIQVDIAESVVRVTLQEGRTLTEEQARQAVREAGFTLRSFSRATDSSVDDGAR